MTSLPAAPPAKAPGQALVIVALALGTLMFFVLMVIELGERWHQVASIEDALQQSSRSAVQTLDYGAMAANSTRFRRVPASGCVGVTQASPGACAEVVSVASALLSANLARVRGLADGESAMAITMRTRWTILPNGGTCTYTNGATRSSPAGQPLLCAETDPLLKGVVGWGTFRPRITAGDTLDMSR